MRKNVLLIIGVLAVIITGICIAVWKKSQSAISKIGGVDGPTAIFIAGKTNSALIATGIIIGIILIVFAVVAWLKRR
ncbi:MAG: oxaloacetate decarboxylase [Lachnospiraceae bacterium]|nr:oxaloacetate decarboxylase [Lachnospiraceae bacterium]